MNLAHVVIMEENKKRTAHRTNVKPFTQLLSLKVANQALGTMLGIKLWAL
jgi:hypothetical protein